MVGINRKTKKSLPDGKNSGKRQCPVCGTVTHKKGGLLGKKSIPITVDGRVFHGRCLACDPFPPGYFSFRPGTRAVQAEEEDKESLECSERRSKDNNNRSINDPPRSPVVAATTTRRKDSEDQNRNHDSSPHPRRRQRQRQHQQRKEQAPTTPATDIDIIDNNNNNTATGIQAMPPLSSAMLPPPPSSSRPSSTKTNGVPKTLEVIRHEGHRRENHSSGSDNIGDDHSVVSAITMDVHLFQSYMNRDEALEIDDEEDLPPPPSHMHRPGPEVSSRKLRSTRHPPDPRDRSRNKHNNNNNNSHHQYPHPARLPPALDEGNGDDEGRDIMYQPLGLSSSAKPPPPIVEDLIESSSSNEDAYLYKNDGVVAARRKSKNSTRARDHPKTLKPPDTSANMDDDFPSFIMDDEDDIHNNNNDRYEYNEDYNHNQSMLLQQQMRQFQELLQHDNAISPQAPPSPPSPRHKPAAFTEEDIDDMHGILECLNVEECNPDIREQALTRLFEILRSTSDDSDEQNLREFILENNVIEAATKSIWADMQIVEVQEAAMKLLFFIAAATTFIGGKDDRRSSSYDFGNGANLLSKNETVCDSILFTMQNHATEAGIQLHGCLIFASLAASSSDTNNATGTNSDGCLSGAMTMVLNAMSNHGESRSIRKAGLQALHHQCLLSASAETNKRNLIEAKLENGMAAIDMVIYTMEELQQDLVAMDWACQLCWCLSTNQDFLKQVEDSSLHEAIVSICQHYMTNPLGIGLVEASIGTIANLAHGDRKRKELINIGAVELVLDGLRYHTNHFGINYEAALAMGNFALPSVVPGSPRTLKPDAVRMLVRGLHKYLDKTDYVVQGLSALTSMANQSYQTKKLIGTEEIIDLVHEVVRKHKTPKVLEVCSGLISTLATGDSPTVTERMVEHGVVELVLRSLELSTDEKVQTAACLALRNLSCQIEVSDRLLVCGKTSKLVMDAMETHRKSVSIQTSACCIFWNLLSKTNDKELAFHSKAVSSITKAMQSHIESGELLELACGALWVIVSNFEDQKMHVGKEAIDVVACAMVMHPGTTSTLQNSCGLLSHLSSEKSLAETIAKAQCVGIVSEAMCNHGTSIPLLEAGCLTLKNTILAFPNCAPDASVAVSTLIGAMKDNMGCSSFVKEACDLLWVLASEDESIRSKVLALDGISILMKCLEEHCNDSEVETSALGAFNQLAKSSNNATAAVAT